MFNKQMVYLEIDKEKKKYVEINVVCLFCLQV